MDEIVFVGDWVKDRILGSGGFGTVVLWKHKGTNETIATKICKWSNELTAKQRERWTKEVEIMKNFNHPNIVASRILPTEFVKGLEQANPSKLPVLCLEYCNGGDLRHNLNKIEACCGLKENDVRNILFDIKNAVEFLHENNITHRDIKPENIVMQLSIQPTQTNRKAIFKLIDLGYAKELDSSSACASFVGTLQYLAPEIIYCKSYSNTVDFWSLGLIAFEIITGERPFLPLLAPVQWIPYVKNKSSDDICIYETFHGDIEFSSQIHSENYLTEPFKTLIEKWLTIALEFDPHKRGYSLDSKCVKFRLPVDQQENSESEKRLVIFKQLDSILSKKIIKIFSLFTYSFLAYEITDENDFEWLKGIIEKEIKLPQSKQLIISDSNISVKNEEKIVKYWKRAVCTLFLFHEEILLSENCKIKVPIPIQRCIEHPKTLYNFNNSRRLYKSCYFFINEQYELFENFIAGCCVRAEMLKCKGKQILLKENSIDKELGKLEILEELLKRFVNTSKTKIEGKPFGTLSYIAVNKMEAIFTEIESHFEDTESLKQAWKALNVRIQSAVRRSSEISKSDLNKRILSKFDLEKLKKDMNETFINYKKNEKDFRKSEKHCLDAVKISFQCLKLTDGIFQDVRTEPILQKMLVVSLEYDKILNAIDTAAENIQRVSDDLKMKFSDVLDDIWEKIGSSDYADLPYSVLSFGKQAKLNFKIGEEVTNHHSHLKIGNPLMINNNHDLNSLIHESLKLRKSFNLLKEKIISENKSLLSVEI